MRHNCEGGMIRWKYVAYEEGLEICYGEFRMKGNRGMVGDM